MGLRTIYKCDRCGDEQPASIFAPATSTDIKQRLPDGWTDQQMTFRARDSLHVIVLCIDCTHALDTFMFTA